MLNKEIKPTKGYVCRITLIALMQLTALNYCINTYAVSTFI